MANATEAQAPLRRTTYQWISSGKLPDQMMRNCENEKYANSITMARVRLPRSCSVLGTSTCDMGRYLNRAAVNMIMKHMVISPWPSIKMRPYMVEYQWISSDMIQSTTAIVTVMQKSTSPGPQSF